LQTLESGLPIEIDNAELLVRFLFSDNEFNTFGAKANAFMPNPKNNQTSVFRHAYQPIPKLREIGKNVSSLRATSIKSVAIVSASVVRLVGLTVNAFEPPALHANIENWPMLQSDPETERAQRKSLALRLAQHAKVHSW
jgi:hypothetical protein